jgi:hypothetical protein
VVNPFEMPKKYVVRLSSSEREICDGVIRRLDGKSQKVRRAYILLKADSDGPNWTDAQIAEAYHCRITTVKGVRERLVENGFASTLNGKSRKSPPRSAVLDGKQEAKLIATRLGKPPKGYANWSLRLLAEQVVDLGITESISHETCRSVLKKTA